MTDQETGQHVSVDARNLRGIAHPVRIRIVGMLRTDGPATATTLAKRLDLNTGATSYHLRQLAEYGFIVEDPDRGTGRERWWKAAHRSTHFNGPEMLGDDQSLGLTYYRAIAQLYAERIVREVENAPILPLEWRAAENLSDTMLRLTPEEAERLGKEIQAVVNRYRVHDDPGPDVPEGAAQVAVQFQVIPIAADLEDDSAD